MKINLSNQIRQLPLPRWRPLLPLFEATMNAFQAIREAELSPGEGKVNIEIQREQSLIDGEHAPISSFTITDNGVGLDGRNLESFDTAYSDHKAEQGGKGLGRFTWLKAFRCAEIESSFQKDGTWYRRTFVFDDKYDASIAEAVLGSATASGTRIRLVDFKEPYRSQIPSTTEQLVHRLIEHFLPVFLEPNCPTLTVIDGVRISANEIFEKEFRLNSSQKNFKIKGVDFSLFGFRLTTPKLSKHKLVFAANQRGVVSETLEKFIPTLSGRLTDAGDASFVYYGVVQSSYLNEHVNHARTEFDIGYAPDLDDQHGTTQAVSLFSDEISRSDITNECVAIIRDDLAVYLEAANTFKADKVRNYIGEEAPQYKFLLKNLPELVEKLTADPSKSEIEAVLHQHLHEREVKLRQESSKILKDADKKGADFSQIEDRLNDFVANYNEVGAAALAHYVGQRRLLLDHLERAISKREDSGQYPLEKVVHQLIFPRFKTSENLHSSEQNLWIIDERLTYQTFISSDKPLSSLKAQIETDSRKEPDLVLFDHKIIFGDSEHPVKSVTLVEFKKPMLNNYTLEKNPLVQCFEMIEDIRSGKFIDPKSGRPISVSNDKVPAFCYIICDITDKLKRVLKHLSALATPDGQGYYGFHPTHSVYYEVIDYNKLLRDAQQRNRIFFAKLNITAV